MTDRYIAVVVEVEDGSLEQSQIEALYMLRHIDVVEKIDNDKVFLLMERAFRSDDFECIENALKSFGFRVVERVTNDASLSIQCGSSLMTARVDLIEEYAKRKPRYDLSDDINQFTVDMVAWSFMMKKVLDIDFEE